MVCSVLVVYQNSSCRLHISYIELIRLIDNNLSNAIKYSHRGTTIDVELNGDILSFHSFGEPIQDTQAIFKKYVRENRVVGGYGLGLSIVYEVTKRYNIEIVVESKEKSGTTFSYKFKCHRDIMGEG